MEDHLKLKAETRADLEVISAILQDAVVRVGDLAYLRTERRFAAVLNRYRWEQDVDGDALKKKPGGERIRSGLHFDGVLKVEVRNVPMKIRGHVMELLAIEVEEGKDCAATIRLDFSGFATIRLEVECIDTHFHDLSDAWPARHRPSHNVE